MVVPILMVDSTPTVDPHSHGGPHAYGESPYLGMSYTHIDSIYAIPIRHCAVAFAAGLQSHQPLFSFHSFNSS